VRELEAREASLRAEVEGCEAQCTQDDSGGGTTTGGGGEEVTRPELPFDWQGPYPEVCQKCALLAQRLNALPQLARQTLAALEAARAEKALAEADMAFLRATYSPALLDSNDPRSRAIGERWQRETQARLRELEQEVQAAEADIARHESNLEEITRNFNETLRLYNDCVPTCPQQTGSKSCPKPDGKETALVVGPNGKVGSGAELKNKVKDQAAGVLGGFFGGGGGGGSGFSLGGGDDVGGSVESVANESSEEGPETQPDPTAQFDFTNVSAGDTQLGFRGMYDGDGLLISSKIFDSPGDGTFHVQWLEDVNGKIYLPTRYVIYSLYQDWELTVWWTYDHWTNGVHDAHEEGQEVSYGRDHLGDFLLRYEGEQGTQNSIWYTHGFDTAVKGINGLGAYYDVPADVLAGPCPLRLVTHVTLPEKDPVSTIPVLAEIPTVGNLFRNNADGPKTDDTIVLIKPYLVQGSED
jgi:hypothetical protein